MFPKEESTGCLTAHHLEDEFFCIIWSIKLLKSTNFFFKIVHSKSFPTTPHMPKSDLK